MADLPLCDHLSDDKYGRCENCFEWVNTKGILLEFPKRRAEVTKRSHTPTPFVLDCRHLALDDNGTCRFCGWYNVFEPHSYPPVANEIPSKRKRPLPSFGSRVASFALTWGLLELLHIFAK